MEINRKSDYTSSIVRSAKVAVRLLSANKNPSANVEAL